MSDRDTCRNATERLSGRGEWIAGGLESEFRVYEIDGGEYIIHRDRLYKIKGESRNPRAHYVADRVYDGGGVKSTHWDGMLVQYQHWNGGITGQVTPNEWFSNPVVLLEEVQYV